MNLKMICMLKKLFICICLFFCMLSLVGMNSGDLPLSRTYQDTLKKEEKIQLQGVYIGVSGGVSFTSFRDFATSPLLYNGASPLFSLSLLKNRRNRNTEVEFMMSQGSFTNFYNSSVSVSNVKRLDIC